MHSDSIGILFQILFFEPLNFEHQSRDLLASLTTSTLFIHIQLGRRPIVATGGTTEVREASQTARFRGIDKDVTSHGARLGAPDDSAIRILFDLAQVDLGNVGGGTPADALDVIAIENVDLALELRLGQVLLQKVRQSLDAVMLPNLAIPPVERTLRAERVSGKPANIKEVLATHSSQATQRDTVAVVIHRIGDDEGDVGLVQVHMTCCFCRCCDTSQGAAVDDDTFVCHNTWPP